MFALHNALVRPVTASRLPGSHIDCHCRRTPRDQRLVFSHHSSRQARAWMTAASLESVHDGVIQYGACTSRIDRTMCATDTVGLERIAVQLRALGFVSSLRQTLAKSRAINRASTFRWASPSRSGASRRQPSSVVQRPLSYLSDFTLA